MRTKSHQFETVYIETCSHCGGALHCTRTIPGADGTIRQELSCPVHGKQGWRYKKPRAANLDAIE